MLHEFNVNFIRYFNKQFNIISILLKAFILFSYRDTIRYLLQHSLFDVGSAILSEAGAPNVFKSIDISTHIPEQGKQHILNNKIELHESAGTINCIKSSQKSD